jgi:hypothetical protein
MKRGDVVTVAAAADCGKPRPAVIAPTYTSRVFSRVEMSCRRKRALGYLQANLTIVSLNIGDLPVICTP